MADLTRDVLTQFVRSHLDDPRQALELQRELRALLIEAQNFAPFEQISLAHQAAIRAFERKWQLEENEFDRIKELVLRVMTRAERVMTFAALSKQPFVPSSTVVPLQQSANRFDQMQPTG